MMRSVRRGAACRAMEAVRKRKPRGRVPMVPAYDGACVSRALAWERRRASVRFRRVPWPELPSEYPF